MLDLKQLHWVYSSSSSAGQYLKAVLVENNATYYYKLSDFSYGTFISHESELEVIVSRLGAYLDFPVLKYTGSLAEIKIDNKIYHTYVSKSKDYKGCSTAMPFFSYYKLNAGGLMPLAFCKNQGFQEYIDKVFIFDYLICNVDRHGRNIEVLLKDGKVHLAPIFDNGRCLTFNCGNNIDNILKWDYTQSGQGNNFIGGLNLETNLKYVSKTYKVPQLTEDIKKKIFYGFGNILREEHKAYLWKAIVYRYNILLQKGVISNA